MWCVPQGCAVGIPKACPGGSEFNPSRLAPKHVPAAAQGIRARRSHLQVRQVVLCEAPHARAPLVVSEGKRVCLLMCALADLEV